MADLGDHHIVMLDANKDIRSGVLWDALAYMSIHEAILERYGPPVPPTYDKGGHPIDGIFLSLTL